MIAPSSRWKRGEERPQGVFRDDGSTPELAGVETPFLDRFKDFGAADSDTACGGVRVERYSVGRGVGGLIWSLQNHFRRPCTNAVDNPLDTRIRGAQQ